MSVIKLDNVSKIFEEGKVIAVNNVTFDVGAGKIFAILGPSGCGKTTILRLIAGFERPDSGCILLNGSTVADKNIWVPPEKRGVGMVFQDYALFPHLTVNENVAFGLKNLTKEQKKSRVAEALDVVGLSHLGNRLPSQLSGGQQQRIALARALAPGPVLLLLDEPLSNLDTDMRILMRAELAKILQRTSTTAILVTHDQEEAFVLADKVAVLNNGKIEQIGTPEEIYHLPVSRFVAKFVGQADFIDGIVAKKGIDTEIGLLSINFEGMETGEEIQLMVRPDDIDISVNTQGQGLITKRQFKGSDSLYEIMLPSGVSIHSSQPSSVSHLVGSKVEIKIHLDHLVIFRNDSSKTSRIADKNVFPSFQVNF